MLITNVPVRGVTSIHPSADYPRNPAGGAAQFVQERRPLRVAAIESTQIERWDRWLTCRRIHSGTVPAPAVVQSNFARPRGPRQWTTHERFRPLDSIAQRAPREQKRADAAEYDEGQ
jgi:hypothetical protein